MASKYTVSFSGAVIEATVADKAAIVDDWVLEIRSMYYGQQIIVGLYCEWRPNLIPSMSNKTATLQLCVDTKCLILQLLYLDYIPQSIKNFLSDPNNTFVGVEVGDDVLKLNSEYGLTCATIADIQALAMERWPILFYRKPGLKKLAEFVVELSMAKPIHVCRSNWEARVLSIQQIEYCCIDAYASYRIGHKLLKET
ncbi:Werner Syndrome-like exonuclease [Olea europaea var. sylvestris]|uniref:Werner Syndrome-like exonuclease n=1 Tax=Olea europaea var. sylvestris TaxID=158386 RepID=UPI000C1CD215|nr:Werner Syndrome-like exonuclease [Olea europaea var. sylvestris]